MVNRYFFWHSLINRRSPCSCHHGMADQWPFHGWSPLDFPTGPKSIYRSFGRVPFTFLCVVEVLYGYWSSYPPNLGIVQIGVCVVGVIWMPLRGSRYLLHGKNLLSETRDQSRIYMPWAHKIWIYDVAAGRDAFVLKVMNRGLYVAI